MARFKLLTLLSSLLFCFHQISGQCTPDTTLQPYQTNPSVLPTACTGIPFNESVSWACPSDTIVLGFQVNLDSLVIDSLSPLPSGVNYTCDNPNCTYYTNPPDPIWGCINLTGTINTPGTYVIQIYYTAYTTVFGMIQSLQLTESFTVQVNNFTVPNSSFNFSINGLTVSFSDQSTDADSLAWDFGDGSPRVSMPNPVHTYAQPGIYNACLYAFNQFANDTSCLNIDLTTTAMVDPGQSEIDIFPNPSEGAFFLKATGHMVRSIEVWDLKGRLVHRMAPQRPFSQTRLDLSTFVKGTYLLHIRTDGNREMVRKVLLQ